MKKLLLIIALFVSFTIVKANVLLPLYVYLSELNFTGDGWELEIALVIYDLDEMNIDSIELRSSTDTVMLKNLQLTEGESVLVIKKDSLSDEFNINTSGDAIEIIGYYNKVYIVVSGIMGYNYLKFGDYPDAMIDIPISGQSITQQHFFHFEKHFDRFEYTFCNTPSIGEINVLDDACGTLKGKMHNWEGELQTNGKFWLDYEFSPNENGEYEVKVGSYNHVENIISYYQRFDGPDNSDIWWPYFADIKNLTFNLQPGEIIEQDIYLAEEINTSIDKLEKISEFKVYPNPVIKNISIECSNFQKYNTIDIQLLDVKGQEVSRISKSSAKNINIDLNSEIKAGIYILNILSKNQLIYSEKIIVNPF